jgi:predicted CXXCH cytochrome family protein
MVCTRRALASTALLLAFVHAPAACRSAAATDDTCVLCHAELPEPLNTPVEAMRHDIHAQKGLTCVDCHGGDATAMDMTAMSPEKGFRGHLERAQIPAFCGRCHADGAYMRRFDPRLPTDQLQQYWTSVHGQRLQVGDAKVATCVSCHGAHGVLAPDQADSRVFAANVPATCGGCHSNADYMAEYGIPTDQEARYRHSVHGDLLFVQRDFSAPTCNDCHGNHGASPPGASSIAEVCGVCHANNAALFVKSPHRHAFDERGLPECVACHSNHDIQRTSDAMLGGGADAVCVRCHASGSAGYEAAVRMRDAIDHLRAVMAETEATLTSAKRMGMEVSEEEYALRETVRPQLIMVRTQTHLADTQTVIEAVTTGVNAATASDAAAQATLAEAQARRRNLLIPLALIAVLMVLLGAKLRQLEGRGGGQDG